MNKVKTFKSTYFKNAEEMDNAINCWIENNSINVIQVSIAKSGNYEYTIVLLYKEENNNLKI